MPLEIHDTDIAAGTNSGFIYATKCNRYFYHVAFLETCKKFNVFPGELKITNAPCISFIKIIRSIKISWHNTTKSTEKKLPEKLILGIEYKRIWLEEKFWDD